MRICCFTGEPVEFKALRPGYERCRSISIYYNAIRYMKEAIKMYSANSANSKIQTNFKPAMLINKS